MHILGKSPEATAGTYRPKLPAFRGWVSSEPGARFQPAAGRYHLYVMVGCPWAHRTLIVRALKGLEDAIGVTAVDPLLSPELGWAFSREQPDPLYGLKYLRELYDMARPGYVDRVTVPVLWDKKEQEIVNNASADVARMLGSAFNGVARRPEVDLYPMAHRAAIDRWNQCIHATVNAGVYRAGLASTQAAYDEAVLELFNTLDDIERHLAGHRYLVGDAPTEADWRLFPTLVRFEWVYHHLFKCHRKRLADYPNLLGYTRELFQWPGIAATMNERLTRRSYYASMRHINPTGIVPVGSSLDFLAPHGRG